MAYLQVIKEINYESLEQLQNIMNAWTKLGFIIIDICLQSKKFTITHNDLTNGAVRIQINQYMENIKVAHINGNFDEILNIHDYESVIKSHNETLYDKYKGQFNWLKAYYSDPKQVNQLAQAPEKVLQSQPQGTSELNYDKMNNNVMIIALKEAIKNSNTQLIQQLKNTFNKYYESSIKYLSKAEQKFLLQF